MLPPFENGLCFLQVLNMIEPGQYPGSVLIKLGLGSVEEFAATTAAWQAEALKLRNLTSYLLRVHIYQVRQLRSDGIDGWDTLKYP